MPKTKQPGKDVNQIAKGIVDIATGGNKDSGTSSPKKKSHKNSLPVPNNNVQKKK